MVRRCILAAALLILSCSPLAQPYEWELDRGRTPLMAAAIAGRFDEVKLRAGRGESVNAVDQDGRTALSTVAYLGTHPGMVKLLLDLGADPNLADSVGTTALMSAARGSAKNHQDMIASLLRRGANLNAQDIIRQTALHKAAGANLVANAKLLVEAGADLTIRDHRGETPVMLAATWKHGPTAAVYEYLASLPPARK